MMRLKFVFIFITWTVGTFILSSHLQPFSKLTSPFQWLQISPPESSSANAKNDTESQDISEKRLQSEDDSQTLSTSKNTPPLFSATEIMASRPYKKPRPPPPVAAAAMHFRDVFNETYSSQVKIWPDHVAASSPNAKYLIYRCDKVSMRGCGGWADRVKGVIAAYIIANLTGRVFKMEMLSPSCDVRQFLLPNFVNWSLPASFHKVVKPGPDVAIMNLVDNVSFWKSARSVNFLSLPAMKAKYVYYKSNLDYMDSFQQSTLYHHQFSWMRGLTRDRINSAMFKRLFRPSPRIRSKVADFLSRNLEPRHRLVCAHVRTGRNPSLPADTAQRLRETDLPRIWDFLRNVSEGDGDKIFLMSDSDNVFASAKLQPFSGKLFYSSGQIVHVERSREVADEDICSGLGRVVADQFTLMHCDVLVISKSGLSRMAAYVRGSDRGLYCILDGGRVIPCEMSRFTEIYGLMG